MEQDISYSSAGVFTADNIKELLQNCDLPTEDIDEKIRFIAAYDNNKLIGCIGLEQYENHGLLRSLAVYKSYRCRGVGRDLFNRLLELCRELGINHLHLLTTTAEKFFLRKGFQVIDRQKAPESIQSTTEFASVCPANAVYMVLRV